MQITIDIPQEFVRDFKEDKFADSLKRLKSDAHCLAGEYEKELMDMLVEALKNSRVEDTKNMLPTPPRMRWKPKDDEMYYIISDDGRPDRWEWTDNYDDGTCINRYKIGNVFRTKDDADFAAERLKVLTEMREWAGGWDDGVALKYDGTNKRISTTFITFISPRQYTFGEMRFESQGDARKCIDAVGEDRIKKYYFMIPDFNN